MRVAEKSAAGEKTQWGFNWRDGKHRREETHSKTRLFYRGMIEIGRISRTWCIGCFFCIWVTKKSQGVNIGMVCSWIGLRLRPRRKMAPLPQPNNPAVGSIISLLGLARGIRSCFDDCIINSGPSSEAWVQWNCREFNAEVFHEKTAVKPEFQETGIYSCRGFNFVTWIKLHYEVD